ncbi:rfaE bifunctional protein kinase chain/domain [Catalinimonas alkaloidigena]|uniref:PfkB family carbohydrate kinase n=1 Tax=Catalinimonas alkaloidigena TaxID=1075417 RepID=UPI002404DDB1|nr:PfkB family carbohydrate kinase [Catalinimonas alkaloidigena]MDF9796638.1 rfaE bifunctional protein kinase chain/domain [Catalinimonas alkaloidigena]
MINQQYDHIFKSIRKLNVGVIGDFAVDVYYPIDKETGEISLETAKEVYRAGECRTYLGAAGNIVKNLSVLGVADIKTFGLLAADLWGRELLYLLNSRKVDTSGMLIQAENWHSCAYVKPMMGKEEDNRLDFGSYNEPDPEMQEKVLKHLEAQLPELDLLIINQQFVRPLLDEKMVQKLNELARRFPHCLFMADMRNVATGLRGILLKANTKETTRLLDSLPIDERDDETCQEKAAALSDHLQAPVLLTRGENGMMYYDGKESYSIPGVWHDGQTDPVGAGDTAISTFGVCLAAKVSIAESLKIANLASAITVGKLQQTGSASPEEIVALEEKCTYVYHNFLAAHPSKAKYYGDSDIEVVEHFAREKKPRYVVMDHDGTISVLREGWEILMHDMMLDSIAGKKLSSMSHEESAALSAKVNQLISQTTGAPTIVQMQGLVELVHREGHMHSEDILSDEQYKARFINYLNQHVEERILRFQKGELHIQNFTIKGVIHFIQLLKERGIKLYLASGTDEEFVIKEATDLGYASEFDGGIHGAKPDGESAKRKVLRYLREELKAEGEEIIVIGDGPSEIREGRKVGALCVGIASDELRRYGLNQHKRERLIRAGAHVIIPDYAQLSALEKLLLDLQEKPVSSS